MDFSPAVLQFDFTYLVTVDSSIQSAADADCPSTRIAVVRNHASTLCLNRVRKHAELISAETPDLAFDRCVAEMRTRGHPPVPRF